MNLMTHEQALADHDYLWRTYGPAKDISGGYVDQDDLAKLLRKPTRSVARDALCNQIRYWFAVGPDAELGAPLREVTPDDFPSDQMVREIAERHFIWEPE